MASCSPTRTRSRAPGASWPRSSASPATSSRSARPTTPTRTRRTTRSATLTTWDGPITPQASEVAYGAWLSTERLLERIADPEIAFMPDTVRPLRRLAARPGGRRGRSRSRGGTPSRPSSRTAGSTGCRSTPTPAARLTHETRLMPRLAPLLPLEVPVPIVLEEEPLRVRHRLVAGKPARRAGPDRRRRAADRRVPAGPARHAGQHLRRVRHPRPGRGALRAARDARPDAPPRAAADARPSCTIPAASCCGGSRSARRPPSSTATSGPPPAGPRRPARRRHRLVGRPRRRPGARPGLGALRAHPSRSPRPSPRRTASTDDELSRALDWYRLGPWYDVLWGQAAGGPEFVEIRSRGHRRAADHLTAAATPRQRGTTSRDS